jgi:hypothetical protein
MRPEEKRVGAGLPTLVGGRSAAGVFSYSVKTCWTESWVGFDEPAPIVYVDWAFDGRWGENYPYGVVEAESFSSSATLPLAVAPQCATHLHCLLARCGPALLSPTHTCPPFRCASSSGSIDAQRPKPGASSPPTTTSPVETNPEWSNHQSHHG